MYLDYFGLERAPYRITPDTDLFYAGGERGEILDALVYAVVNGEAITKVVGEVGSGKTMLCRMLGHKLPESVEIVYLANPSLAPENVLHAIAFELDLPVSEEENRLKVMKALQDYLLARHAENRQVVVFVEEAQGMPLATLEEIRLLSNLETQQHKLLQVVLFGQPELDVGLSAPHVRQIKERITNSFYLPPLKRREIKDYLMFRLHLVGFRGAPVFSHAATWLISHFSNGLMRRINIIADKTLLAAFASGRQMVTLRDVIAALRDCEFVGQGARLRPLFLGFASLLLVFGLAGWAQLDSYAAVKPLAMNNIEAEVKVAVKETAIVTADTPVFESKTPLILESRLAQTGGWLATAAPENLTIQLLWGQSDKKTAVEQFLRQAESENLLQQLFVYRTTGDKQDAISVVMGEYTSLSQAQAALNSLSQNLKRYQPYLRNMKSVLAEAEPTVTESSS